MVLTIFNGIYNRCEKEFSIFVFCKAKVVFVVIFMNLFNQFNYTEMKLKSIITTLIMLLCVVFTASAAEINSKNTDEILETNGVYTIVITGNSVIGRDGPAGYDTGVRFYKGQRLTCYGMDGSWYKVKYGNGVRWVSSSYATPVSSAKRAPVATNYVVITGNSVIGRKSPAGADSGVRFFKGQRLPYLGYSGSWIKINYKGRILWVSDSYAYIQ